MNLFSSAGMAIFRFASARIVEEWSIIDIARMRMQLDGAPEALN